MTILPTKDYHEDYGCCLFFHFHNFSEPPEVYCGSAPESELGKEYWTHFTKKFNLNSVLKQVKEIADDVGHRDWCNATGTSQRKEGVFCESCIFRQIIVCRKMP